MNLKEPVNSLDDIKWVDQEDDGYENGAGLSTELADFRSWGIRFHAVVVLV